MATQFSDISFLLGNSPHSNPETKKEDNGINPLLDNLTVITSLVQTADHARKLTGDPLATDLWRLYTKAQHHIPQAKRFENLMWRRMAIKLVRAKPTYSGDSATTSSSISPSHASEIVKLSKPLMKPKARLEKNKQASKVNLSVSTSVNIPEHSRSRQNIKTEPLCPSQHVSNKDSTQELPISNLPSQNYNLGYMVPPNIQFSIDPNQAAEYNALVSPEALVQSGMLSGQGYFQGYTPDPFTAYALAGGDGRAATGNIPAFNNMAINSNQVWYDPTYANFSSMLNRNWTNFDDPTAQTTFSPLNHSTFMDYVAVNNPVTRRNRTHLDPTAPYPAESVQTAQANRIRQLEQQINILLADRTTQAMPAHQQPSGFVNPMVMGLGTGSYNGSRIGLSDNSIAMGASSMDRSIRHSQIYQQHSKPPSQSKQSSNNPSETSTPVHFQVPVPSKSQQDYLYQNNPANAKYIAPHTAFQAPLVPQPRPAPVHRTPSLPSTSQKAPSPSTKLVKVSTGVTVSGKETPTLEASRPICDNCGVDKTSLWRRAPNGAPLCNACGLFSKLHGKERPLSMKTSVIRKRNRGPAGSKSSQLSKRARTPDP